MVQYKKIPLKCSSVNSSYLDLTDFFLYISFLYSILCVLCILSLANFLLLLKLLEVHLGSKKYLHVKWENPVSVAHICTTAIISWRQTLQLELYSVVRLPAESGQDTK